MSYPRLSIEEFGKQLIASGDLDPVYIMLRRAREKGVMDDVQLKRWCLVYWCFYHAGVASFISTNDKFWYFMHVAAANTSPVAHCGKLGRWPRGAERRHFRGEAAKCAVSWLEGNYSSSPEEFVNGKMAHCNFKSAFQSILNVPQFGPWIAFKVVDMLVNVFDSTMDLSNASLHIYKEPGEGAELACKHWGIDVSTRRTALDTAIARLRPALANYPPLHAPDRSPGIMEIETVLCKWKSHMKGSYPLMKDTKELKHVLTGWGETAGVLKELV